MNLDLGLKLKECIYPFVGIHPETVRKNSTKDLSPERLEELRSTITGLTQKASGIGEIGMDPGYGALDLQRKIMEIELEVAESYSSLPICIHSRNALPQISDVLSRFTIRNRVLFHWFADSIELSRMQSRGYFVSFGPAAIFSKHLQSLLAEADEDLILPETDSPLIFRSLLNDKPVTPFAISSVIFKMAQVRKRSFKEMLIRLEKNTNDYLQAQNSLRV